MNKLSVITSFLGGAHNRYMVYQTDRDMQTKIEMAKRIEGLDGFELAYPRDFDDPALLKRMLDDAGLGISAINFRSRRTGKWWRGSFTSASADERQEVVDDLRQCMDYAAQMGVDRITTCPLNDGADYLFEMNYIDAYNWAAETFDAICAHTREIRLCIEYKVSDPRARCIFGSAGEVAGFCATVDAPNLGATFDIGHALYVGERPAQSLALLARAGRLFHVHLNDNDGRWDWDMIPGAFHMWEFVECFWTLRKLGYTDDWYAFDVFPKEIDTVANFTAAMRMTRKLEAITDRLDDAVLAELMVERDPSKIVPYLYSLI